MNTITTTPSIDIAIMNRIPVKLRDKFQVFTSEEKFYAMFLLMYEPKAYDGAFIYSCKAKLTRYLMKDNLYTPLSVDQFQVLQKRFHKQFLEFLYEVENINA